MLNNIEVDSALVDSKIFDPEEIKKVGYHTVKILEFVRLLIGTLLYPTHATFPGFEKMSKPHQNEPAICYTQTLANGVKTFLKRYQKFHLQFQFHKIIHKSCQ